MRQSTARPSRTAPARELAAELVLRRHTEDGETAREVVVLPGHAGARLVVDRDLRSGGHQRLLALLDADEPASNAALICERYLATPPTGRRCRPPRRADELPVSTTDERRDFAGWSIRSNGCLHALLALPGEMSIPELRWTRSTSGAPAVAVSLRSAIAHLESYEPFCEYTIHALTRRRRDPSVSSTSLQAELTRVQRSPIVLNRGLREAVLASIGRGEMSMSEIAMRCGRLKRDAKGNRSGETSWLARRIGLLPEGGHRVPTPWVHTDVLALIAREGLGIAPREVELG
jgi:hypothetical protein